MQLRGVQGDGLHDFRLGQQQPRTARGVKEQDIRAAMAAMGIGLSGLAAGVVTTGPLHDVITTGPIQEVITTGPLPGTQGTHPAPFATFDKAKNGFGVKRSGVRTDANGHSGYDFLGKGGEPVFSSAEGKVVKSYSSSSYGNTAIVEYEVNGQYYYVTYAHLRDLPSVQEGQTIPAGTTIGYLGMTGKDANGVPHLHLDVRQNSNPALQLKPDQLFDKSGWKGG